MPRHNGARYSTGRVVRRRRRMADFPWPPFAIIVMILVIVIVNLTLYVNFSNSCEDKGGSAGIMWSRGGFKCTDDNGHIIDVF